MDDLLSVVREAAAESFHVYGELGRESNDDIWYLGKDRQTSKLVALRLHRIGTTPEGKPDYDLEVARELDGAVAVGAAECFSCGAQLRRWARFCTKCGIDLTQGGEAASSPQARVALLRQVTEAAIGVYDVLGEMPWAGGAGSVYFAVERETERLVRLRLRQEGEGFELGETRVMMPLHERLSAVYVTQVPAPVRRSEHVLAQPFTTEELAVMRSEPDSHPVGPVAGQPARQAAVSPRKPLDRQTVLIGIGIAVLLVDILVRVFGR